MFILKFIGFFTIFFVWFHWLGGLYPHLKHFLKLFVEKEDVVRLLFFSFYMNLNFQHGCYLKYYVLLFGYSMNVLYRL